MFVCELESLVGVGQQHQVGASLGIVPECPVYSIGISVAVMRIFEEFISFIHFVIFEDEVSFFISVFDKHEIEPIRVQMAAGSF